jgi:CBS domain-containing protein
MTVSQICQRDVDLVDLDESAWAAADRMQRRSVGVLFVLNKLKQPIGMVTDGDLVVKVLAPEKSPRTTRVRDILQTPVQAIPQTLPIHGLLPIFRAGRVSRLPVVDHAGKLVGVVTLDDVLALLDASVEHGEVNFRASESASEEPEET